MCLIVNYTSYGQFSLHSSTSILYLLGGDYLSSQIDYQALGHRIQRARKTKGLTQAQLGEECSLTTGYMSHIENGTRILSVDTLYKISSVLNVSIDYLIFDSHETDDNLFSHIQPLLKNASKPKKKAFLNAVRALADNIDEL